jgi:hypothetical protein
MIALLLVAVVSFLSTHALAQHTAWLPLHSDFVDGANSSYAGLPIGPSAGVFANGFWTGSQLLLPTEPEAGPYTLCAYLNLTATISEDNTFFFSCEDDTNTDCAEVWWNNQYNILATRLNSQGAGDGVSVPQGLPNMQWFHICVVYSPALQVIQTFVDARPVNVATIPHTAQVFGSPLIAPAAGVVMSISNVRFFANQALDAATISYYNKTDYPSSFVPLARQPVGPVTPPPSGIVIYGLVHHFVLNTSDYDDLANSSGLIEAQGDFCPCSSVSSAGWSQTCDGLQQPASLQPLGYPESGDVTLAVYVSVQRWAQQTGTIFSCNDFEGGGVDCLDVYYDSVYGLWVSRLNAHGPALAAWAPLPLNTWTHVAATYASATAQFVLYVDGAAISNGTLPRSSSSVAGLPVLANEGANGTAPIIGTFYNLRQYSAAIAGFGIQYLASIDHP